MLALYLDAHLAGRGGARTDVLYFAPDWGMSRWLARRPGLRLRTTDLAAPDVDFHCDITAMREVADASFDLVLCCHVLEHVPDDGAAMRELHRVTRPGGVCVVQVPYARGRALTDADPALTDRAERQRRFGQFDHLRLYGRDLPGRLSGAGFAVTPETGAGAVSPADAKRYGLWDDTMFVCHRRTQAQALAAGATPARAA
jgi:SAM-dependent methyltransferase